jgi:hypothetical protein
MRYSDEQLLEATHFCVGFLRDKFPNERGLFRSSASQTYVRDLQTQLLTQQFNSHDDVDPHIMAEVIQTSLKNLQSPLLHEVYQDILHCGK